MEFAILNMSTQIETDGGKKTMKSFKHYKPYWNEDLTNVSKGMNDNENGFIRYRGDNKHCKTQLLLDFRNSRSIFGNALRKTE